MKALVTLALLVFASVIPQGFAVAGQTINVSKPEKIDIDPTASFQETPWSFCVTEDNLFLIPDSKDGTVKIFEKGKNSLNFLTAWGVYGFGKNEKFQEPRYCSYNLADSTFAVLDYKARKVFIFRRPGKLEFVPIKTVNCPRFGYDMELAGDGKQLIISGFLTDSANQPYDLYSINIGEEDEQISYLLPSHEKYGLENSEKYVLEYRKNQTIPAIGIKAYIDRYEDDLFFVWEGAPRIIRLKLNQIEERKTFGLRTTDYTIPDGAKLSKLYKKGDFQTVWEEQKRSAYVRNIFAARDHIFLVYEMAKSDDSNVNSSKFRLQAYANTPEGNFLGDVLIPGNPRKQMWLSGMLIDEQDYKLYELYAFSQSNSNGNLSILKYRIKVEISK